MHPATKSIKDQFLQDSPQRPSEEENPLVSKVSNFLEMAFSILSLNPNKRPQTLEALLNFEFLRADPESDLSEEQAREQLRRLLENHVK